MFVYLVHHGDALPPGEDARRPLSPRGLEQVGRLAAEAHRREVTPAVVWHSGKLRARQTAEAFWRACQPFAEFSAVKGLQPTDPAVWMKDRLTGETRDVMCVGHLPSLARLLNLMVGGDENGPVTLPLNGLVALESAAGDRWEERWRLDPTTLVA